jgi:hypothetical protein
MRAVSSSNILLHASTTFDQDAIEYWVGRCPELEHVIPLEERAYPKGALVGIADLVEAIPVHSHTRSSTQAGT